MNFDIAQVEEAQHYLLKATSAEAGEVFLRWPLATGEVEVRTAAPDTLVAVATDAIHSMVEYLLSRGLTFADINSHFAAVSEGFDSELALVVAEVRN